MICFENVSATVYQVLANAPFPLTILNFLFSAKMCESGTVYKPCGPFCEETCEDISLGRNITDECEYTPMCSEGCFCPPGYVLDGNFVLRLLSHSRFQKNFVLSKMGGGH
jgi:hypothetical protein